MVERVSPSLSQERPGLAFCFIESVRSFGIAAVRAVLLVLFLEYYLHWRIFVTRLRKSLTMSMHYPVFCYNGQFRRGADGTPLTYMLHGHIHKSEDQVLVDRFSTETRAMMRKSAHQETAQPVPCQMINCFCMYSDYTPLTLEEWVECDQRRRDKADR